MIEPPERSPERDAALDAMARQAPFRGWNQSSLRNALAETGRDADDALLLFPGGAADMVEAFIDLADRRMGEAIARDDLATMRLTDRVRALIAARLALFEDCRDAVRRAAGVLAAPGHALLAARCTARTVDEIWHLAGDRASDASWYTKRGILAGVYGATLLYWLRDYSEGNAGTLAFLDRRLASVALMGRLRRKFSGRDNATAGRSASA